MAIFKRKSKKDEDKTAEVEKVVKTEEKAVEKTSTKKVKAPAKKPAAKKGALPDDLRGVILHPLVTEKAATQTSLSKYVFVVATNANRIQVRNAVRHMYGIKPESVNILKMRGKRVRFGRLSGKRKDWKKAVVTFPKGTTIDAYEGV